MEHSYDVLPDLTGLRASYRTQRDTSFSNGDTVGAHNAQSMIIKIDKLIAIIADRQRRLDGTH